ncbi:MAG: hypothetical protein ABI325_11750 [Ginsengibacter sp.]
MEGTNQWVSAGFMSVKSSGSLLSFLDVAPGVCVLVLFFQPDGYRGSVKLGAFFNTHNVLAETEF